VFILLTGPTHSQEYTENTEGKMTDQIAGWKMQDCTSEKAKSNFTVTKI